MRRACLILLAGLYWSLGCAAVKFDLPAVTPDHIEHSKRCLSQYVPKDTLVFARVNVGPGYNQRVDIEVKKHFSLFEMMMTKKINQSTICIIEFVLNKT